MQLFRRIVVLQPLITPICVRFGCRQQEMAESEETPISRTLDARHIPRTLTQGYQLSSPLSLSCFSQHYKHLGRQCFEQPLAIFTHGIEL